MNGHLWDVLFGFIGGAIPGSVHFAWKVSHNSQSIGGSIDLTYRAPREPKK